MTKLPILGLPGCCKFALSCLPCDARQNAVDAAELELYFAVDDDCLGQIATHELLPGGKAIRVTDANKQQYVELYCGWLLYQRVRQQCEAIKKGLYEVIAYEQLALFDEKELELLLGGLKELDLADWRAHTDYKKYREGDRVIGWFWQAVESFGVERRMRLLQFVTGTARLPVQGFRDLHGSDGPRRFTIERLGSTDGLPRSHTCFNRLDLPPYGAYATLYSKLVYAIEETVGFAVE